MFVVRVQPTLRISILLYSRTLHSLPVNIDPIPKDIIEDFGLLSLHNVSEPAAFVCPLNFPWHTLVFFIHVTYYHVFLIIQLPCLDNGKTVSVELMQFDSQACNYYGVL